MAMLYTPGFDSKRVKQHFDFSVQKVVTDDGNWVEMDVPQSGVDEEVAGNMPQAKWIERD